VGGVLHGFAVIALVIALGALLAHGRVLDSRSQEMLSKLTFYVGSPALLIGVLSSADVKTLFSTNLVASVSGVAVTAIAQVVVARYVFHRPAGDVAIGAFCSSYVNAGNLGLPIAAYALGDVSAIAPMLLVQLLVLQPAGLAVLDVVTARAKRRMSRAQVVRTALLRPVRNPMTIGSALGVVLSVTGWHLPSVLGDSIGMVGGLAVPCMLLAYGVSLRTGPLPGREESPAYLSVLVILKLIVQPLVAWAVGAMVIGLAGPALLAVTIIAALPTAQNVFVFAVRYGVARTLARDAIFLTTILSIPAILTITALLG
jgi:predicted permease